MTVSVQPTQPDARPSKAARLAKLMDAIIDAVHTGGDMGAPSGIMYAALYPYMELGTYKRLMETMVHAGLLTVSGQHTYHLTDKGKEWHHARCSGE